MSSLRYLFVDALGHRYYIAPYAEAAIDEVVRSAQRYTLVIVNYVADRLRDDAYLFRAIRQMSLPSDEDCLHFSANVIGYDSEWIHDQIDKALIACARRGASPLVRYCMAVVGGGPKRF